MKQRTASELIESFINDTQNHLTREDRAFCDKLISQRLNEYQMDDLVSDYILKAGHQRNLELRDAQKLALYIENYITVFAGLLLSYSPDKNSPLSIPKKYYRPVPQGFKKALIVVPQHNLIIKGDASPGEAWYGSKRDKAGMLVLVGVFKYTNRWLLFHHGRFIDTHYPRFSVECPIYEDCPAYTKSGLLFDCHTGDGVSEMNSADCKMGPNRAHLCMYEKEFTNKYGINLTDLYALTAMCYDRWQRRPVKIKSKRRESYNDMGVSHIVPKTPQWEHMSEGFREIQLREYPNLVETIRTHGYHIENRMSPCEHERRGHMRTLKDGRKIYVRPSIVNKGGEKVVYRVSG